MNIVVRKVVNKVMGAFVGAGIGLDDDGRLELPDGLDAVRVHRFIEICTGDRFDSPREAMHALFVQIGVPVKAVGLLNRIIDDDGDVDFTHATRHGPALLAVLHDLQQIPVKFRDFLVDDLALASPECATLAEAVASTRVAAAEQVGCDSTWEAILGHPEVLSDLSRPWRERMAAA